MAECQMPARERPRRPPPPSQRSGATGQMSNLTDMQTLQSFYDDGFKLINTGLTLDEEGQVTKAIAKYNQGLQIIAKGLDMNVENFKCSEDQKNEGKMMQQKMTKTRLQIEYRLQTLERPEGTHPSMSTNEVALPSYEEAISSPSSLSDEAFLSLGNSIMSEGDTQDDSLAANATEMLCIPEGVQIFYITASGYVSAPSYPTALKMFQFLDAPMGEDGNSAPPAFLQVDNWFYPLVPGTSPALHASNGAYIFPDTTSQEEGSAVGLLLPSDISPALKQQFEQTLASFTNLQEQNAMPTSRSSLPSAPPMEHEDSISHDQVVTDRSRSRQPQSLDREREEVLTDTEREGEQSTTSAKISRGITVASEWITWGVGKGTEKAGQLMRLGSNKLKEKLKPEDKPVTVDPKVQKSLEVARKGTHVAVSVSSFLVTKLGEATKAIAKQVAPHIRKQGEKLLPESFKQNSMDERKQSKVDSVLEVAASGVKGFGVVYMSLEAAAKTLARNIANETVSVVDHKYGNQAARVADNALYAVGNVAMTANNVDSFGVKAIAKRAAKDAGKEVVKDAHKAWKTKQDGSTDLDNIRYTKTGS